MIKKRAFFERDIVIIRARLSILANSAKDYSDAANDSRVDELLKLTITEWEDMKRWAAELPDYSYYNNIRKMCETIQMLRDLQD